VTFHRLAAFFFLALVASGPAAAEAEEASPGSVATPSVPDPFREQAAKVVEDLASLPGDEIRGAYLQEVLEGAPPAFAERLRAARELLEILTPLDLGSKRFEALLRGAMAPEERIREAALEAARSGSSPPPVPTAAAAPPETREVVDALDGPLDDLTVGVGGIDWGTSSLVVKTRLGESPRVSSADGWSGPTYPQDLAVVTVEREFLGCTGETAFIFTSQGLSRVWFTGGGAACWSALSEAAQDVLGLAPAEKRFTPAGAMFAREWDALAEVTLAVGLEDGEPTGDVYLHLQPPDGVLPDEPPYLAGPAQRSGSGRRDASEQDGREARGLRLKGRAGAHLGTGFGLLAAGVALGVGGIVGFFDGPSEDRSSFAGLMVTGIGLGTASGILLVVGGAMDIHASILLASGGGGRGRSAVDVRFAFGLGRGAVVVRF